MTFNTKLLISGTQLLFLILAGVVFSRAVHWSPKFRELSNGNFDSDTAGWETARATVQAVDGGHAGRCLELNAIEGDYQYAIQWNAGALEKGVPYELTFWVKSGTSGDQPFRVGIWDAKGSKWIASQTGASSKSWTGHMVRFTNNTTDPISVELVKNSSAKGTMLFDSISLKEAH